MKIKLYQACQKDSDHYAAKQELVGRWIASRTKGRSKGHNRFSPQWNVVGIGVAEKVVEDGGAGIPALTLMVRRKAAKRTVGSKRHLIPAQIDGIPTDVVEVGCINIMVGTEDLTGPIDPIQPGCSIGYQDSSGVRNAGTLGAVVSDGQANYLLRNFHVLNDLNLPSSSPTVTQPGNFDTPSPRIVGTFERGIQPSMAAPNVVDAALARIAPGVAVSSEILAIGSSTGVKLALPDMVVEKYGRSTGYRAGIVQSTVFDILVGDPGNFVHFVDQICIAGLFGQPFADHGDSGSLVLERPTSAAVGLLFATSQGGDHSFANHLSTVLKTLRVDLAQRV